jgi:hypothetical protein
MKYTLNDATVGGGLHLVLVKTAVIAAIAAIIAPLAMRALTPSPS